VFKAITPTRVVDTRIGKGLPHPLGAAGSATVATSSVFGDVDTVAMVANVTGLDDPSRTYLTVYRAGASVAAVSSLNLAAHQTASGMVMPALSSTSTRSFALHNRSGTVDTLVDVVGFFESTGNRRSITTVRSSSTSSTYDTALTLTASVVGNGDTPTGTVTFTDASNGSILGVEPLSGGVASLTTAALAPGARKIVAAYKGPALASTGFEDEFAPSTSAGLPITVAPPATTVATAFQNDPRHDGMDTGDIFNPATLHKTWSINFNPPTGTADLSYPLIAGGRVFITAMDLSDNNSKCASGIYALDATTGHVDWQILQSTPSCTRLLLTYDGGQLFVQESFGSLTAYDASSGHINWTTTAPPGQNTFSSAPTAYDGVVYTEGDGYAGTFYALGETNGAILWSHAVNGNVGSPAVDDTGVYGDVDPWCSASSGFGLNGTIRWNVLEAGCSSGFGPTPVLNGSHLYLYGFQAASLVPAQILSTTDGASIGTFGGWRLPAFDATNMYLVLYQAGGSVLDAVGKSGSPTRWSFAGDGTINATPVTTNGIVFTGSIDGHLYGIDSSTGAQVWTATAPGRVLTADGAGTVIGLAAADGLLAVPASGFLTVYAH
jgi:outer membrane protein assembly factor BamB